MRPLTLGSTYSIRLPAGGLVDIDGRPLAIELATTFQTACSISMRMPFRRLLATEPALRTRLGCPSSEERVIQAAEEVFQGGHILWRSDSGLLIVSFDSGDWATFPDFYDPNEPIQADDQEPAPPEGALVPTGRFGRMWRFEPGIFERLGYATSPERTFQGVIQPFSDAQMLWTGEGGWQLRVLYTDGTLGVYADPDRPR